MLGTKKLTGSQLCWVAGELMQSLVTTSVSNELLIYSKTGYQIVFQVLYRS